VAVEHRLGAIVRTIESDYLTTHRISADQGKVLRAIKNCRTSALGGRRDRCDQCGKERIRWNSCRNRHCPQCQYASSRTWLDARLDEVLPVGYFHVVFTIPDELRIVASYNAKLSYDLILRAAGRALLEVGRTKLGVQLGVIAILHTWTQLLMFHPHVHCVVPAGGFSLDGQDWIKTSQAYLLSWKVLSRRFRTLVVEELRQAWRLGRLRVPLDVAPDTTAFDLILARASRGDWIVHAKEPFASPAAVLAYLGSYTHRIAISNERILGFDGSTVTFRYRDRADGDKQKVARVPAEEFLRRFLLHVVPTGFVRIRYYGFYANRSRAANLDKARQLIREPIPTVPARHNQPTDPDLCPHCRLGHFALIEIIEPFAQPALLDTS
jgi:hypothetical protein